MTEGDARKFKRFVRELDRTWAEAEPKAATAKSSAKAGPAPAAKAALLAMAAKSAAKSKAKAAPAPAKQKKPTEIDGIAIFFNADLPSNAFMLVTSFLLGS